ncbi:TetR/AcrR family transcriptional regulator C-terminal domain-containing protein [Nocardia xishanensis]
MTTSDDTALPKSVELLWRLDQPGGRGPKRGLTLDQILEAAIEVADAEGYEAPPMGPNNMAWLEAGLATLADTPVPEPVRLQLVMNQSLYVIGRRWAARDMTGGSDGEEDFTAVLRRVLDPQRFPAIVSALTNRAFDQDDIDWEKGDFEFGLARMLDGYETLIRSFER